MEQRHEHVENPAPATAGAAKGMIQQTSFFWRKNTIRKIKHVSLEKTVDTRKKKETKHNSINRNKPQTAGRLSKKRDFLSQKNRRTLTGVSEVHRERWWAWGKFAAESKLLRSGLVWLFSRLIFVLTSSNLLFPTDIVIC